MQMVPPSIILKKIYVHTGKTPWEMLLSRDFITAKKKYRQILTDTKNGF